MAENSQIEKFTSKIKSAFIKNQQGLLKREQPSELFCVVCSDSDGIIETSDNCFGAVFASGTMNFSNEQVIDKLKGAMSGEMRPGTMIQFSFLSVPNIGGYVSMYKGARASAKATMSVPPILLKLIDKHADFYKKGCRETIIKGFEKPVSNSIVLISIKVPRKGGFGGYEEEVKYFAEKCAAISESARMAGLAPEMLPGDIYLRFLRQILFMNQDKIPSYYSPVKPMNKQIFGAGDSIRVEKDRFYINDMEVRMIGLKSRPEYTSLDQMNGLIGDPMGGNNQIGVPFLLTTTIHFLDRMSIIAKVKKDAGAINYQTFGPMLKWSPKLALKKEGFDTIISAIDNGEQIVNVSTQLALFGDGKDETKLAREVATIRSFWQSYDYIPAEESHVVLPSFFFALPLHCSPETEKGLERFETMGLNHACQFLPILGDWEGTGAGAALMYLSRRNQPVLLDFYDSSTSKNAVIFSGSGGGKSFLINDIIASYLSLGMGTRVWVIDTGYSYFKLCKLVGGEYLEFQDGSDICLNPFTSIKDLDDEMDYLKGLFGVMCRKSGVDDMEYSILSDAIRQTYNSVGNNGCVTDVANLLRKSTDPRARDLGQLLQQFTRSGSYGKWFDGAANIDLDHHFVVLELQDLNTRPHLKKVILFILMQKIQEDISTLPDNIKKIMIVDEAADQLKEGDMSLLLEGMYRKIRKSGGMVLMAMQAVTDLYTSASGIAIAQNSPHKIILEQTSEAVNELRISRKIDLDEFGYRQIESLRTRKGNYSEAYIHTANGGDVIRIKVDAMKVALYASSDEERTEIIEDIRAGVKPLDSILNLLKRKGVNYEW